MKPTPEQQEVVALQLRPSEAAKVTAYAGTGKTTTFVAYAAANPRHRTLYLAFNKSVADEAGRKFGPNVLVKTVHALAYQYVGRKFKLGSLQQFRVSKELRCDVYVGTLICQTLESWWNSAEAKIGVEHAAVDVHSRLPVGYPHQLVIGANRIWSLMLAGANDWSMTHAGYLKLFEMEQRKLGFDTILVDEAQDTNPVTQSIVETQRKAGSRVIWTGDRFQQIYSWRGAVNAMDLMEGRELFLTQSFRFGKSVADTATAFLGAFFQLKHPVIGLASKPSVIGKVDTTKPHTVLTRSNGTLFKTAYDNLKRGVPTAAGGRSFDTYLDTLMDVWRIWKGLTSEIQTPSLRWFKSWHQFNDYVKSRLDIEMWGKIELVNSMGEEVKAAVERLKNGLVNEDAAVVSLCTAHRAKGLEWDSVILAGDFTHLLDDADLPVTVGTATRENPESVHPDEINLLYVAITRAKLNLVLNLEVCRLLSVTAHDRSTTGTAKDTPPETGYAPNPRNDEVPFEYAANESPDGDPSGSTEDDSAILG